jgi:PAS domain S-box-containing protein
VNDRESQPGASERPRVPAAEKSATEGVSQGTWASPVKRARFNRALILTVLLPFLLMGAIATVLLWSINDLLKNTDFVQHTGQVITQAFRAEKLILDMETGLRGYVITSKREFLEPYENALHSTDDALARLDAMVGKEDSTHRNVAEIQSLFGQWKDYSQDEMRKIATDAPGTAATNNDRGKQLMDKMRAQFDDLIDQQQSQRRAGIASARHSGNMTLRLGFLLTVGAGLIVAFFAGFELFAISRWYEDSLVRAENLSQEVAARESHFRVLAETIPQIVWASSPDGSPEYFNQRWFEYVGETRDGRGPWTDSVPAEARTAASQDWNEALSTGKAFAREVQLRDSSGNSRWHLARALPLRDETGRVLRWLGTFTDIDDQKRAAETLGRLAAIVETSDDAIYSKDLDGYITSWNRGAQKMYGYSADEIVGKNVAILCPPDRLHEVPAMLTRLRRGESIQHYETLRLRKDGQPVEVSLGISPIETSPGVVIGASTIARDITERNRAADALRKTEKFAASGRLAGTIAHEINNPLEAITHLLYLLERNSSLDPQAQEYARLASEEVNRVAHIARQALGFYREAAAPVAVNISDLIDSVVHLYKAGAQNKGVTLEAQLETEATVPAYPGEMRQVFSNLVVNAVDAVDRGGTVKVRVKHGRDWRSKALGIRVLVSDNGPGIPPAVRKHIFEPFFTTKGERGTGVGLWVSEGIMHKHGGSMRLKSSTGERHGTTFSVFVPYTFS